MNKKAKIGIGVVAVAVVAGLLINSASAGGTTGTTVETISATSRDLTASVSATGMVESQTSRGVYSVLTYQIDSVDVKVGDQVNEGDVLAQLDTSDLELQIAQQKATISASAAVTGQQVNAASENLSNAQFTNDSGLNAQIISAQANVDSAQYAVQSARSDLASAVDSRDSYSTGGTSGGSNIGANANGTITAEGQSGAVGGLNGNFNGTVDIPGTSTSTSTQDQLDTAVEKARIAVNSAENTLANAQKALQATLNSANIEMDTYEQQLAAARANNNYSAQQIQLKTLQKNLDDATVKAPISGTVTAVYAEDGASGSGLLFIVEDINSLKIETTVKEFDVLSITPGEKVIIQADATGDDEYEGTVESVAPTATKASGTAATAAATTGSTTSEFAVTVHVSSAETRLKVGMNTRLQIVTAEAKDVQSLPSDAIITTASGDDAVYVARQNNDGKWVAEEQIVTLGLETDYYIEITYPKFVSSDLIISNPENVSAGTILAIDATTSSASISSVETSSSEETVSSEESSPEPSEATPEASTPVEENGTSEAVTITSAPGVSE